MLGIMLQKIDDLNATLLKNPDLVALYFAE